MKIVDRRQEYIRPLKYLDYGAVFIHNDKLFMLIDCEASCFPEGTDYTTSYAAVELQEFNLVFFDKYTPIYLINNVELVLN